MKKSRLSSKPRGRTKTKSFQLIGGLNEITAPLSLKPGELYGVSNYEPGEINGYRRIKGYERLDGRPSPTEASYWILNFDGGNVQAPAVGSTIQGVTSGAKGEVGEVVLSSGAWDGTGVGYFVIHELAGIFTNNELLTFTAANDGFDNGFSSGFG